MSSSNVGARIAAAVVVTVSVVAGCGLLSGEDDAGDPEMYSQVHPDAMSDDNRDRAGGQPAEVSPIPDAGGQQDPRHDPFAVMVNAAEELFTWWPAHDANRGDATVRAAEWLVEDLVVDTSDLRPGPEWQQWADAGVEFSADAEILDDQHPPDTEDVVSRVVQVVQTRHDEQRSVEVDPVTVWITVTRQDSGIWLVANYQLN